MGFVRSNPEKPEQTIDNHVVFRLIYASLCCSDRMKADGVILGRAFRLTEALRQFRLDEALCDWSQ